MSIWAGSARRMAIGAIGAGAVGGAMLFGALPSAQAAPVSPLAPKPAVASPDNLSDVNNVVAAGWHDGPMPQDWHHHHHWWRHWWWWW